MEAYPTSRFLSSPATQVHSPEPNLIGWERIWGGVAPGIDVRLRRLDLLDSLSRFLTLPVDVHVIGVVVGKEASPRMFHSKPLGRVVDERTHSPSV